MSTEHDTYDNQRWESTETGERVEDPGIQAYSADQMQPGNIIAEIPGDDAAFYGSSSAHDQRWHEVLADFVDDPRGSVLAASDLVVNDVSAFVAVLDKRRKNMMNAPPEDYGGTLEDLRQVATTYRDISKHLNAGIQALRMSYRGTLGRDDLPAQRRDVIGGRFDASGGRHVAPRRDAQMPPGDPSSQDQRW